MEGKSPRKLFSDYRAALTMNLFFWGYNLGICSLWIVDPNFYSILRTPGVNSVAFFSIVSISYLLGCLIGSCGFIFAPRVSGIDIRSVIWFCLGCSTIGILLQVTSYSLPQVAVGLFIAGVGNGLSYITAHLYFMAVRTNARRRILQVAPAIVFSFVTLCNSLVVASLDSPSWRYTPALPLLSCVQIYTLRSKSFKAPKDTDVQIKHLKISVREIWEGLKGNGLRCSVLAQLLHQLGGIIIIAYFFPSILVKVMRLPAEASLVLTTYGPLWSLVGISIVEIWHQQRHYTDMGATGLIAICLVAATVAASMWRSNDDAAIWSIMSFFSIWLCFFYTSVGLEISSIWRSIWKLEDPETRIQHTAAATFTSLVSALILVGVAPVELEFLGWKFLLIITVMYIFLQSLRWSFYLVNGKSDRARPE